MDMLPVWGWVVIPISVILLTALGQHFYHDHAVEVKLTDILGKLSGKMEAIENLEQRIQRMEDIKMGYQRRG